MKRIITKIGDVFCMEFDEYKCYLQYVANDMTQLNSSVIRVFKHHYPLDCMPTLTDILKGDVDFYAHMILYDAISDGVMYKVGRSTDIGNSQNFIFRCYELFDVKTMRDCFYWYIWKINHETIDIGPELLDEYKSYPYGLVFSYPRIINKIKTGYFYDTLLLGKYRE